MPLIAIGQNRRMADYLESVRRAGGEPLEVSAETNPVGEVIGRVKGLMLTGGGDVDPMLYGEQPHETYLAAEPGRDEYEIALVKAAVAAGLPIFAICRGMQLLNVALGGTLHQDLPTMVHGALDHATPADKPRYTIAHEVWVAPNSLLAKLMVEELEGEILQVNSRHHQAVNKVAPGWEVTATAPEGVIEAIEQPGAIFRLAVQWHPENFYRTGEFRPLFEGFVEACR